MTLVNQGESVLVSGCHWGREIYCLSGRMWAWSCWGHFCHPVGTASLRMKLTQRNKGWEMEVTIPYKNWAQSCLTPGMWVNHLPFCLSQAELDFSPSPTKSGCWLPHSRRVLHSLGTPDTWAQWLRLCHAPGVHQGGKEDCLNGQGPTKKPGQILSVIVPCLLPACCLHCLREWPVYAHHCALQESKTLMLEGIILSIICEFPDGP